MAANYRPPTRKDSAKHTWRIENFSDLSKKTYSEPFMALGYEWRITTLSFYNCLTARISLLVEARPFYNGWSVTPEISLTLVDQRNGGAFSKRISFLENWYYPTCGEYQNLHPIPTLEDKGYLVDDTIIIEAEFSVVQPVETNLVAKLFTAMERLHNAIIKETYVLCKSFTESTMCQMSTVMPRTKEELLKIQGFWKDDVIKHGDRVLQTIEATIVEYYENEGRASRGNAICDSLSPESQKQGASKDSSDPEVIEPEVEDQCNGDSSSLQLSNKVARTDTITSPCSSSVQSASKNLIAELSAMAGSCKSTSVGGISASLQQQREKLATFFEMSLETIFQTNRLDSLREAILKISELSSNSLEKTVMEDMLSHLQVFKLIVPVSMSTIQSTPDFESCSEQQTTKELEGSLVKRQKQLTFLDAEVSRIEQEKAKAEAQIQLLVALRDRLAREKESTVAEMEVANREASKELEELTRKRTERKEVLEDRLRAKANLAQANASWKVFKEVWGY